MYTGLALSKREAGSARNILIAFWSGSTGYATPPVVNMQELAWDCLWPRRLSRLMEEVSGSPAIRVPAASFTLLCLVYRTQVYYNFEQALFSFVLKGF